MQQHGIEQRLLAVLDGYHWSDEGQTSEHSAIRAMGRFAMLDGSGKNRVLMMGAPPTVQEVGHTLRARVPLPGGSALLVTFEEDGIAMNVEGKHKANQLLLSLEWVLGKSSYVGLRNEHLMYCFRDFDYKVRVLSGKASETDRGVRIKASAGKSIRLGMT